MSVVLLGMQSGLLVTLGYGTTAAPPPPPVVEVPSQDHWGHWPFVRRRLTSTSTGIEEEVIEAFVEEVEEALDEGVQIRVPEPDWSRVLDEALEKIQAKLQQERFIDLPRRKEERKRLAELARLELIRIEDEEAAIAFLLME